MSNRRQLAEGVLRAWPYLLWMSIFYFVGYTHGLDGVDPTGGVPLVMAGVLAGSLLAVPVIIVVGPPQLQTARGGEA